MTGVLDLDRGISRLLKEMQKKRTVLTVGVHGNSGSHGRTSVLQIANWLHEGTSRMPARPFVRQWFDYHFLDNVKLIYRAFQQVVAFRLPSIGQALHQLGSKFVAGIQAEMASGAFAPLAATTIRRKGSSKPLIDTGVLRSSIRYQIKGAA